MVLATRDPTTLILVGEADRLRMASLEQVRATFDAGETGLKSVGGTTGPADGTCFLSVETSLYCTDTVTPL
jgi:hypothetical protein